MTTWQLIVGGAIRDLLAIPDEIRIAAVVPVGWPARDFAPGRRGPVEAFIHEERW